MREVLIVLLLLLEVGLALLVGYLVLLTALSLFAKRTTRTVEDRSRPLSRFAILIPAHNEQLLLPELLESLARLDYSPGRYSVYVVADNCTDSTAEIARRRGAHVYERTSTELIGKGYALQWLIEQVLAGERRYDGYVIVDADSVVSTNFLRVLDSSLRRGADAVQAYYTVRAPDANFGSSIRYAALALVHYLRPLGRSVWGGSPGLKGNGMCFSGDVLRRFVWSASLTEDIEYHMALMLAGCKVVFAPDAVVWAEMPGTLRDSQTQNVRWEKGRMQMVRAYVPRLLAEAWRRKSFVLFDAAVEQLIPPFAVLAALTLLPLLGGLLLRAWPLVWLGVALLLGQVVYVVVGLLLVRAPHRVYLALLGAPVYVFWKLLLYVRILLGRDRSGWVRTRREREVTR